MHANKQQEDWIAEPTGYQVCTLGRTTGLSTGQTEDTRPQTPADELQSSELGVQILKVVPERK